MPDMPMDLVIRGGTVTGPGHREIADIGVRDGQIAQLGGAMTGAAELDADGLLVVPGGIDAHVHLVCAAVAAAVAAQYPGEPAWSMTSGPAPARPSPGASRRSAT